MSIQRSYPVILAVMLAMLSGAVHAASKRPSTVAELAFYQGADRQQILEEGARKEGTLTFYTTGILQQGVQPLLDLFQKRYPFISVNTWRSSDIQTRIIEEEKAGSHQFDIAESAQLHQLMLQKEGVIQPFFSPHLAYIFEDALTSHPGQGVVRAGFRESGIGLGYNTTLISREQIPKTYKDLLNPKWTGKMPICGNDTGRWWMSAILASHGEDFVKKLAQQKFQVHMVSGAALLGMVINGEYAFSPDVFDSHVKLSRQKGASIDWLPLEPVNINLGEVVLSRHAPHPHAALLFIDLELSKENAEILKSAGYNPTRKDVSGAASYQKFYGAKSLEEMAKWGEIFNKLFLSK